MIAAGPDQAALPPAEAKLLRVTWPLALAGAVFAVVLAYLLFAVGKSCGGQFGYPMDDTYIHMAMARALSQHGVWGLTQYGFSSTSSSLLFTALLAAVYFVGGPRALAPLVLNIVIGFVLLWFLDYCLRQTKVPPAARAALLLAAVFGMPLGPETIAGMEHPLHTLLTLAFVFVTGRELGSVRGKLREPWLLFALAALVVLARYEALALVFAAAGLLVLRRRPWTAAWLSVAGCGPVAAFGLYSVHKGWYPVPNSIVAKVSRPGKGIWPYPLHWAEQLSDLPSLIFLGLGAAALLFWMVARKRGFPWNSAAVALVLFVTALLLHMQFGRIGWFYRYEAYLIVLGIYATAAAFPWTAPVPGRWGQVALVGVLLGLLAHRAVESLWLTPYASRNIHEQQYQMGRFLRDSFAGETVLMSDIGAAAYLSDARIVDLYGLATIEVARAKVHHAYTQEFRRELARKTGARFAILYPAQYTETGGLPPEWMPVGTWTISENQICWSDTVTFLALDEGARRELMERLRAFRPKLPADVAQAGRYLQGTSATAYNK